MGDLIGGVVAVAFVASLLWLTLGYYHRRLRRVQRSLPEGAWSAPCVEPTNSRSWRLLVAEDAGVSLLQTNGRRVRSWAWGEIVGVQSGPVRTGLLKHPGVVVALHDGTSVGLLLPSKSTLRYPAKVAAQAVAALGASHGRAGKAG